MTVKKVYLVYHDDKRSRVIKDVHVAVFEERAHAEEFVKKMQKPAKDVLDFNRTIYRIAEVDFVDAQSWAYWRNQIEYRGMKNE